MTATHPPQLDGQMPQSGTSTTASDVDSTTSPCLVAKIENAKTIYNVLKAIHFKDRAICHVTPRGFKFTVQEAKAVQAHAYLQESLFQEFAFTEEELTFGISLPTLTECLNIFGNGSGGTPASLRLSCLGYGHPLILMLEEAGITTKCKIVTFEPEEPADFEFRNVAVVNKIIMRSEWLKEAFDDLDPTSPSLSILVSPASPFFRLSTEGSAGTIDMDYPNETDVIESFQCEQTQVNSYRLSLIQPSAKALSLSKKTSLRTNERGILSIQFMIAISEGQVCFIEYLCLPIETPEPPVNQVDMEQ